MSTVPVSVSTLICDADNIDALMFFMLSKIISGRPLDLDVIVRWFNSMREFVPASSKYLINLCKFAHPAVA